MLHTIRSWIICLFFIPFAGGLAAELPGYVPGAQVASGFPQIGSRPAGRVVAWGMDTFGQASVPSGANNVIAVAAGLYHSVALNSDGTVTAWGAGKTKQEVSAEYGQSMVPPGLNNVVAIAAGAYHTLALKSDGTVVAWGAGSDIRYTSVHYYQSTVPSDLTNVVAIAAGDYHSLALKGDGTVVAWGAGWVVDPINASNQAGQSMVPASAINIVAIAAGGNHSLALRGDGKVIGWGNNFGGALDVPSTLYVLTNSIGQLVDAQVQAIASGQSYNAAVVKDIYGQYKTRVWGFDNGYGQGNVPYQTEVRAVAVGKGFTMELVANTYGTERTTVRNGNYFDQWNLSSIVAWGDNTFGQMNFVTGSTNATAIAAGAYHALAIVLGGPIITAQPANQTATTASNVTFSVGLEGTAPLAHQWWKDGAPLAGATGATLPLSNLQTNQAGNYSVVVSGPYSRPVVTQIFTNNTYVSVATNLYPYAVTSAVATLTVNRLAQNIAFAPIPTQLVTTASFMLAATSSSGLPLAYTSANPSVATVAGNVVTIVGIGSTLITASQAGDATWLPAANASQTLYVTGVPPSISVATVSQGVLVSNSVAFNVTATGTAPLGYQWRFNGANIPGAVSNVFTLPSALGTDAGSYSVVITNAYGAVTSAPVLLTIYFPPSIIAQPANVTVYATSNATFTLNAGGTAPLYYRLFKGATLVGESPTPSITLNNVGTNQSGNYYFVVTNLYGVVTSSNSVLTVMQIPQTIYFGALPDARAGDVPVALSAFASTGRPVTFASSAPGVASIDGSLLTVHGPGSAVITASQPGDANFIAASVSQILNVTTPGALFSWGDSSEGQLGLAAGLTNVVSAVAGYSFSVALKADGTLTGVGYNGTGALNLPGGNFKAISAGATHMVALRTNGTVAAWGDNTTGEANVPANLTNVVGVSAGQFCSFAVKADGSVSGWGYTGNGLTNVPANLAHVRAIAASDQHVLALKADGTIVGWGDNTYGQSTAPAGLSNVTAVAAGFNFSVALTSDGRVVAWGDNSLGQTSVPAGLTNVVAIAVGGGWGHGLALKNDGTVVAWGYNNYGQTNVPAGLSDIVAVGAGGKTSMAIKRVLPPALLAQPIDLAVVAGSNATFSVAVAGSAPLFYQWRFAGDNILGATNSVFTLTNVQANQAGLYSVYIANPYGAVLSSNAVLVVNVPPTFADTVTNFTADLGSAFTLTPAILGNAPLYFQWRLSGTNIPGANSSTYARSNITTNDAGIYSVIVTNSYGALTANVAVVTMGQTIAFGAQAYHLPTDAPFSPGATANSGLPVTYSSYNPYVAVVSNNLVMIVGPGRTVITASQPGNGVFAPAAKVSRVLNVIYPGTVIGWGDTSNGKLNIPAGLNTAVAIAGGDQHSVALRRDGVVFAWGDNSSGQTTIPAAATNIIAIAAGAAHNVACRADGTVVAWGDNTQGQCDVPAGLSNVIDVVAGSYFSVALKNDQTVVAWGANYDPFGGGQLNVPAGLSNVVGLAAGVGYCLAIRSDGSVVAWGENYFGQTTIPGGLNPALGVASGGYHSLAVFGNGSYNAWGKSSSGQLLSANYISNPILAVSAGYTYSLALLRNGTVVAWGGKPLIGTEYGGPPPGGLANVVAIAGAGYHTLAIANQMPFVSIPPADVVTTVGSSASFSVSAVGHDPISYQWRKNGVALPGENNASLQLSNVQTNQAGTYSVVVSNSYGVVTNAATLTVNRLAQNIAFNSIPPLHVDDSPYALSASASSGLGLAFASSDPNVAVLNGGQLVIVNPGVATITATQAGDSTYLPTNASQPVFIAPQFTEQPGDLTVSANDPVSLSAAAASTLPIAYQWYRDGVLVPGATNSTLSFNSASTNQAGAYSVTASNLGGVTWSGSATLTVNRLAQAIAFAPLPLRWLGAPKLPLAATASSGLPVVFSVVNTNVASINNNILTTAGVGLTTVIASQPGDGTYQPAADTVRLLKVAGPEGAVIQWGDGDNLDPIFGLYDVVSISGGDGYFFAALRSNGTVTNWGFASVNPPAGATNIIDIAAGYDHVLALRNDGTVLAWGGNGRGQRNVPAGLTNVVSIGAGEYNSFAVLADGSYVGWGWDYYSKTSDGNGQANLAAIVSGDSHTVALKKDGTVVAWGNNSRGQCNVPASATNVVALVAGFNHTLALRADGTVVGWGANNSGQLNFPAGLSNVVTMGCGSSHSIVSLRDGTAVGAGSVGIVDGLANVLAVSAGLYSDLALIVVPPVIASQSGDLTLPVTSNAVFSVSAQGSSPLYYQWLKNGSVLAGATNATLTLTNVQLADAGSYAVVVTNVAGSVTVSNMSLAVNLFTQTIPLAAFPAHQVGDAPLALPLTASSGLTITYTSSNPKVATLNGNTVTIAGTGYTVITATQPGNGIYLPVAASQTLFVVSPAGVLGWGDNNYGQLNALSQQGSVISIAGGNGHVVVAKADGTVAAWGDNTVNQTAVPAGLTNVVAVAAGYNFSLALRSDGTVVGWGDGGSGQLNIPGGLSNVVAIAAESTLSVALRADGSVVSWGYASYLFPSGLSNVVAIAAGDRSLGVLYADGTVAAFSSNGSAYTTVPPSLTNAVAIAAGAFHLVGLKADGTVVGWGDDSFGQATPPPGLVNVVSIAAGYNSTVALKSDGTLVSWGTDPGPLRVPVGLSGPVTIGAGWHNGFALFQKPVIFTQPVTKFFAPGTNLDLTISAFGAGPLAYQWFKNGALLQGATNNTLSLVNAQLDAVGKYFAVVGNSYGSVTSAIGGLVLPQTIAFAPFPLHQLGEAPFPLTASSSSGLPLVYSSSNPRVATIDGTNVTVHALGFSVITASQPGDNSHAPAATVTQVLRVVHPPGQPFGWGYNYNNMYTFPADLLDAVAVSAHQAYTLVLRSNGTVRAYGDNGYGQCAVPASATNVAAVSAGMLHGFAIRADGSLVGWGLNNYGQVSVPANATNVVAVTAGDYHSTALRADGTLVSWGFGSYYGQNNVPADLTNVVAIAEGTPFCVAVRSDGTVVQWGSVPSALPSGLSNVVDVAANQSYVLALKSDGTLVSWGDNAQSNAGADIPAEATNVVAMAVGVNHVMALRADGSVVAWGENNYGQTNIPVQLTKFDTLTAGYAYNVTIIPAVPASLQTQPVSQTVNATTNVTLSVSASGSLPISYTWYKDGLKLAGATNATLSLTSVSTNNAGAYYVVATNFLGGVTSAVATVTVNRRPQTLAFAPLASKRLGDGTFPLAGSTSSGMSITYSSSNPRVAQLKGSSVTITGFGSTTITATQPGDASWLPAASINQVLTVTAPGAVAGWGDNSSGQLNVPAGLTNLIALAAGGTHTLGLRDDGTVAAWGNNSFGQTSVPAGLSNVIAVAAGNGYSLALKNDGTVLGWGLDTSGQATAPGTLSNVVAISACGALSLALGSDGTVTAWGDNSVGQATVPGDLGFAVGISAGNGHALALRLDGTVAAWGSNASGQTTVPANLTNAVAIAAGAGISAAVKADGAVVAWGDNSYGENNPPAGSANATMLAAGIGHALALQKDGTVAAWGNHASGQTNVPAGLNNAVAVAAANAHSLALLRLAPIITAQPQDQILPPAATANLSVGAFGQSPLNYQWFKDGAPVPGATNSTLAISNLQSALTGNYAVLASNAYGAVTSAVALVFIGVPVVQAPPADHVYEFNGTYADSMGGPDAVPAGGTLTSSNYTFAAAQGPSVTGALASPDEYTIEMVFRATTVNSYACLINFKDPRSDNNLYINGGKLDLYPESPRSPVCIAANREYRLVVTRTASTGQFLGYIDGKLQLNVQDSQGVGVANVPGGVLNFFRDNGGEDSAGSIDLIRIYNQVLTPAQVAGLSGLPYAPNLVVQNAGTNLVYNASVVDLGAVKLGTNVVRTLTITNTGLASLTNLAVVKDGPNAADFILGALSTNAVAPGAKATFTITFAPTATGSRQAAIHIVSSDILQPAFTVGLTGAANAAPSIAVQPASQSVLFATNLLLSVTANGWPAPAYQWFYTNGVSTNLLADATNATLSISPVLLASAGGYFATITNSLGAVTSQVANVTVRYAVVTVPATLPGNTNFGLTLQAEPGRAYWLEMKSNLNDVTWYYVSGVTNANGLIILQDRLKQLDAKRFYRIGTCPAP